MRQPNLQTTNESQTEKVRISNSQENNTEEKIISLQSFTNVSPGSKELQKCHEECTKTYYNVKDYCNNTDK
jgi:hypothetical protein